MPRFDPSSSLTPEQRRTEVAALLARGILRAVRARRAEEAVAAPAVNSMPLEVSTKLPLSVVRDDNASVEA